MRAARLQSNFTILFTSPKSEGRKEKRSVALSRVSNTSSQVSWWCHWENDVWADCVCRWSESEKSRCKVVTTVFNVKTKDWAVKRMFFKWSLVHQSVLLLVTELCYKLSWAAFTKTLKNSISATLSRQNLDSPSLRLDRLFLPRKGRGMARHGGAWRGMAGHGGAWRGALDELLSPIIIIVCWFHFVLLWMIT